MTIAIDSSGNKWFGTHGGGISKFDGIKWSNFNTSNSTLLENYIKKIVVDKYNSKWILSYEGINIINADGNWRIFLFQTVISGSIYYCNDG